MPERNLFRSNWEKFGAWVRREPYGYTPDWTKWFPLPQSLTNPRFVRWARSLDRRSKSTLVDEMVEWRRRRLGFSEEQLQKLRETPPHPDSFGGILVELCSQMQEQTLGEVPLERDEFYEELLQRLLEGFEKK